VNNPVLQVIILSAIPGAGKSTYATHFASAQSPVIVSADNVQRENAKALGLDYDNGGEGSDPSLIAMSHPTWFREFLNALRAEAPLVMVDNTNLSKWEIAPYLLGAEAFGYNVKVVRLVCDPLTAFNRQRHGVPYAVVKTAQGEIIRCATVAEFEDEQPLVETTTNAIEVVGGFLAMVEAFEAKDVNPWWNVESVNLTPNPLEAVKNGSISY
jgi:hypothetical protein